MQLRKEFKSLLRQLIVYHCRLVNLIVRGAGREGERKRLKGEGEETWLVMHIFSFHPGFN